MARAPDVPMTHGRNRTPRPIALILMMWVALEAASFSALPLLRITRQIEYAPISTTSLSEAHRAVLEDLLRGQMQYAVHSALLGWTTGTDGSRNIWRSTWRRRA
jgi:hypothetical protein